MKPCKHAAPGHRLPAATRALPENKIKNWACASPTLTDGADDASVACCDWLLVDVQQTEVLQEGVGHAGVQLLALDEGVWQCHHI